MKIEIKNRFDGEVIICGEYESIQDCLEKNCEADLREADLSKADLRMANLRMANLSMADLREADLSKANLREADLSKADLRMANLRKADLSEANLRGADLCEADLRMANLRKADLRGVDLDYSCWPLFCGSLKAKTSRRQRVQLMFHTLSLMNHCDDLGDDEKEIYAFCLKYANEFHRTDVEKLEPKNEED